MEENRSDFSKHATLLAILGFGLILLGMVGFHQYYSNQAAVYSWFDCFYLSLQLIPMNSGGVSSPVPLQLNIARFALPMLAAYAFFSLIWFAFRDRILTFRLRRLRDHIIVCGLGRKGYFLARDYQGKNCRVVLIEKDPNNKHLEAYRQNYKRAPVLIADACDKGTLHRVGVSRAKLLISTLGRDADNASVAEAAKEEIEGCRNGKRKEALDCKIDVTDYEIWTLLRETEFARLDGSDAGLKTIRLSFFNVLDSGARYVVNKLRGQDYFNPAVCGGQNRIGIIGLSKLGELLILHIAREWSEIFRSQGKKITLLVWDTDVKRKIETIQNKYPIVKSVCDFLSFDFDIDNPLFETIMLPDCQDSSTVSPMPIYVCVEDQNVCVNISMTAMRAYRELQIKIVALLSEDRGLLDPLNKYRGERGMAELQADNLLEATCRPDVLDDGTHETLAHIIHDVYSKSFVKKENRQSWETLEELKREQNRDQARCIGGQLHAIGCGITPWIEYGKEIFQFTEKEIEIMAEKEHERWMKFYIGHGLVLGPDRYGEKKTHPCLVPWEQLSEDDKKKDRNTARNFPMYLGKAGFQIYRMKTVSVSAPSTIIAEGAN